MDEASRQKLEIRVARLGQQIRAFKELHASELGLILDELAALRSEIASLAAPARPAADPAGSSDTVDPADPAAASPKRAKWLAEERRREELRKAPLTRREMLGGREPDPER